MTYSLVAFDAAAGEIGVAVQSHWFSVGSVVPHARPGVGAVATQSVPEPSHGPRILDLLADGAAPDEALDEVLRGDAAGDFRQTAVVDVHGRVAVHTGSGCMPDAGHHAGRGWSAQANMMSSAEVWPAMAEAFAAARGERLPERLLGALDAAEAAGGDVRGRQSAALLVVPASGDPWTRVTELRVEDSDEPLAELRRLLVLDRAYSAAGRADELMAEGDEEGARRLYDEAASLAPGKAELQFWAALFQAVGPEPEAGLEGVRRAIAGQPGLGELLARLTDDIAPGVGAVRDRL
jgi:uncharacterized Ntn-hydrolase superfamily protein